MAQTFHNLVSGGSVVLLDGAMGTELSQRGVETNLPLWSAAALEQAPGQISQIHRDYVDAGAQIITANTFRTTAFTYRATGIEAIAAKLKAREMTQLAIALAKDAAADRALVAASLAPVADCYTPADYVGPNEAYETFYQLTEWVTEAGADLLLIETQITLEETARAFEAANSFGLPTVASYLVDENLTLWGGATLNEAVALAEAENAAAILVNCITLQVAQIVLPALAQLTDLPFGIYANAGLSSPEIDGTIEHLHPDGDFADHAEEWIRSGATIIGGCCGTTPSTIGRLRDLINSLGRAA